MAQVVIVGCGGIGQALQDTFKNHGHAVTVISRQYTEMDLTQPQSIEQVIDLLKDARPELIINTIGMLHNERHQPEKSLSTVDNQWLHDSVDVNVLPTLHLAKALSQLLTRQSQCTFISFSARVSSISDNYLGGWYSYRMSKCMLNMLIKNIAIEWKRSFPQAIIAGYHPGTVDTPLSKPYQANVAPEKLFTPQQAAAYCLSVIEKLNCDDSGFLFDWQGKRIEF